MPALPRTGKLEEIPPGDAVLRGHDGGAGSQQWRHLVHDRRNRVGLQGEDDAVLRACLGGVVGAVHPRNLFLAATQQRQAVRPHRFQMRSASDQRDFHSAQRQLGAQVAADGPGPVNADFHLLF